MTKCSVSNSVFQGPKSKKIEFNFDGGDISSDGGLLFIKEFDRKLGLTRRAGTLLNSFDNRQSRKVKHSVLDMLRQRVFALVAGNEDLNDHHELRNDPLIQTIVGRDRQLATPSTLCRFENGINGQACIELSRLFIEFFVESFTTPPHELILDFDATDDLTYGMQEKRFFHGYYDHYCFLPLYVFCGDQLLCAYLRPSKIDAAKHSWAILSLLVKRLRKKWPKVNLIFRGDSGFCRQKMLNWCDKNNVKYIVGLAKNSRLLEFSKELQDQAETSYEKTHEKVKLFTEFKYAAGTWKYPRRVIAKAEFNSLGPNNRFIVTNLDDNGQHLYEKMYCARGDMENRIKEQQLDLFADRTSCHDFVANQFRLLLSSLAYILMERFRTLLLDGTKFAQATCGSIRLYLVKIGAVIRRNTRKIYVALSSACPNQELLRLIAAKIIAME
ncbi:MAG: IS1380 family transposase [Bacilli bacterium]|nr:IS1380 family transposase [Bacilli bacterium]